VKHVRSGLREAQLADQGREDIAYYRQRGGCRTLVGYIYDSEGMLRDWPLLSSIRSEAGDDLEVRWVVSAP
jgi:hypothetical protein